MTTNRYNIHLHEDSTMFQEALTFTAAETAFSARLIEKDYYCSVLLEYLASTGDSLVFKGGTCLAKIYTDFYRMSEDLDFVIPMVASASRKERSSRVVSIKNAIASLNRQIPVLRLSDFEEFNLDRAFAPVAALAEKLLDTQ
ncbi:nucleotidyl transferase AbiEii/AbiGii toxin family protein [bacterium]|nr:nucleotidyl transferase AbiEii/AbiGii toxin family protein [bacterium]